MSVKQKDVHNALVFYDGTLTHRWYDAIGPGVIKYLQEFACWPHDDTTLDPTEWTDTVVEVGAGTSTAVITDLAGGALLITTAGNENDGWSMQLGNAAGESIKLESSDKALYVGARFAINDADQTDILIGVTVTDTAVLGAVTDGMYFRSVDESAVIYFVTEKDSVESSTALATMTDDAYLIAEFLYLDGTVKAYANGVEITSTADSAATFPDNEELRLTVEFLTGEAVANTCTVDWLRMIHIR